MRVLYIYAGTRRHLYGTDCPKTQFYGLFGLKSIGIDASYKEFDDIYPKFLAKIIPFNIRHMLMYFPARKYDIVFGSALLPMMFFKIIFGGKAKFILLNISLTRLLASQKQEGLKHKVIRYLVSRLDGIVCLSAAQCEYLKAHAEFPKEKIFAVPFGVDTGFYTKGSESYGDTILSVGRDNGRDYQTVFSVAEKLPQRRFVVVCSRRNIKGLTVPSNVDVKLDLSHGELLSLYRKAHVLLLLTHGKEHDDGADCSGQTVLLEAMATGLPAVVSLNDCLSEYISLDENAIVVPPHDASLAVEAIRRMDDFHLRESMSLSAYKKINRSYTIACMAKNLETIFNTVIAR